MYGYPSGEAAEVAGREVRRFLEELEEDREKKGGLERVVFCIFEAKDERAYGEWLPYVMSHSTGTESRVRENSKNPADTGNL